MILYFKNLLITINIHARRNSVFYIFKFLEYKMWKNCFNSSISSKEESNQKQLNLNKVKIKKSKQVYIQNKYNVEYSVSKRPRL